MSPDEFLSWLTTTLDGFRMSAMAGDLDAAEKANLLASRIESGEVPAAVKARTRAVALEAEGYALRHLMDHTLVQAEVEGALGASNAESKRAARDIGERIREWKLRCNVRADAAEQAGDATLSAAILNFVGSLHIAEVLNYTRLAPQDTVFQGSVPDQVRDGLSRAGRAELLFAAAGEATEAARCAMLKVEWLWVGGLRAEARVEAAAIVASAPPDDEILSRAAAVANGGSPLPEYDSLPAIARPPVDDEV